MASERHAAEDRAAAVAALKALRHVARTLRHFPTVEQNQPGLMKEVTDAAMELARCGFEEGSKE